MLLRKKLMMLEISTIKSPINITFYICNYGHDSKHLSFGTLTWTLDGPLRGLTAKTNEKVTKSNSKANRYISSKNCSRTNDKV